MEVSQMSLSLSALTFASSSPRPAPPSSLKRRSLPCWPHFATLGLILISLLGLSMARRDVVFPPGRQELYERYKYSPAIRSNGFLFVSGQVGSDENGSPVPGLEAQIRRAFDNLNAILNAAGCTFADVIDTTMFIIDPEDALPTVLKVKDDYWGPPPHPTLTAVGVTWLSGFRFEIKVVALLPQKDGGK